MESPLRKPHVEPDSADGHVFLLDCTRVFLHGTLVGGATSSSSLECLSLRFPQRARSLRPFELAFGVAARVFPCSRPLNLGSSPFP